MTYLIAQCVWLLFLASAGITIVVLLAQAFSVWPSFALLLAGAQIVVLSFQPDSFQIADVGGIQIAAMDVFALGLTVSMIVFSRSVAPAAFIERAAILFLLVVLVSTLRGVITFGIGTAVNDARPFYWMLATFLWSSRLPFERPVSRQRFLRMTVGLGWLLSIAASIRLGLYGFGVYGTTDRLSATGNTLDSRALVSGQALVLLFCAVAAVTVSRQSEHKNRWLFSAATFGVFIALSEQRTVWLIAIVALAVAVSSARRTLRPAHLMLLLGLCAFLGAVTASGIGESIITALVKSGTNLKTYQGRSDGWQALVSAQFVRGPAAVIAGSPFGSGYARIQDAVVVNFSPHNWYVSVFLRVGLPGLLIYLLVLGGLIARATRPGFPMFERLVIISFVIYQWTYSATWYAALFVGAAMAFAYWNAPSQSQTNPVRGSSGPDTLAASTYKKAVSRA